MDVDVSSDEAAVSRDALNTCVDKLVRHTDRFCTKNRPLWRGGFTSDIAAFRNTPSDGHGIVQRRMWTPDIYVDPRVIRNRFSGIFHQRGPAFAAVTRWALGRLIFRVDHIPTWGTKRNNVVTT